jgi:cytidyltransferase-like protein
MDRKKILGAVFSLGLAGERATPKKVSERLGVGLREGRRLTADLSREGLVSLERGAVMLTPKGRKAIKVVFIGGGFEVIHHGHAYTIGRAKELGDVLVVAVATDSTIRRRKQREPLANEQDRVRLLSSLRQVDVALLGVEGDIYVTLEKVRPDIVALGYDQYHMEDEVVKEAAARGMRLKVVRLDSPYPKIKTSALLKEF